MATRPKKQRIILCAGANGRAVIVGDVAREPTPGKPVRLTSARMVLYWDSACGGLLGLAAKGPKGSTRMTHAAATLVETVWQEWCSVSEAAAREIDKWPAC